MCTRYTRGYETTEELDNSQVYNTSGESAARNNCWWGTLEGMLSYARVPKLGTYYSTFRVWIADDMSRFVQSQARTACKAHRLEALGARLQRFQHHRNML